MAIVALGVTGQIAIGGVAPVDTGSLVATTNTYTFPNDGAVFLHVKKTGAGICVCTFTTPITTDGLAVADPTVSIPATTGNVMIGPFRPETYNDPTTGFVSVVFSETTGLTVAVLRFPRP